MKRTALLLLTAILLMTGCVRRPKGVLSDKKMAPIVADLELAEAYIQVERGGAPDRRDRMVAYVIDKHGVSRADFDTTMAWYGRNVDEYQKLYKSVDKILAKRQREFANASPTAQQNDDKSDIWSYSHHAMISAKGATNALTFSMPTLLVEKGDQLKWRFRMRTFVDATAILGVEYEGGEMTYVNKSVHSAGKSEVVLQTDTAKKVARIFGNLHVLNKADMPVWVDSIAMIHLPYDSLEYFQIHGQRILSGRGK
jgi:hypothetical protein